MSVEDCDAGRRCAIAGRRRVLSGRSPGSQCSRPFGWRPRSACRGGDLLDLAAVRRAAAGAAAIVHLGALAHDTAGRPEQPRSEWEPFWEYGSFVDVRDVAEAVQTHSRPGFRASPSAAVRRGHLGSAPSLELASRLALGVPVRDRERYAADPCRAPFECSVADAVLGWLPATAGPTDNGSGSRWQREDHRSDNPLGDLVLSGNRLSDAGGGDGRSGYEWRRWLVAFHSVPGAIRQNVREARGAVRGWVERRAVERRLVRPPRRMSCQCGVLLAGCAAAALA